MIAWTIAGSDSGGGAGIQADLKTFHNLGVHGCTVITALTAQNTQAVTAVERPSLGMINAQIDALSEDLPPKALKTGMLGDAEVIDLVAKRLKDLDCFVVCDPVMVATSGDALMETDAKKNLIQSLFPQVDLLTPNLPEAEALTGMSLDSPEAIEKAAESLVAMGVKAVLIKGGHGSGEYCQDCFSDGAQTWWLTGPRTEHAGAHGSGCTLSAAIAALVASGHELANALVLAKAYIYRAIRQSVAVGQGAHPVLQSGLPDNPGDMPWITRTAQDGLNRPLFPDCGGPLGFYPILPDYEWLKRIIPQGVKTVQLRVKDLEGASLREEIEASIALARKYDCRLFINDHWRLAVELGAYGVHLGQEDLVDADLQAIAQAGLRLGVSTHNYEELARGIACNPSYVALGPVFPTTTKQMPWKPQGSMNVARWRELIDQPLVAIGGLSLENGPAILEAGADSLAVITAITLAEDPLDETGKWLALFI